jgi:hypothetical protein
VDFGQLIGIQDGTLSGSYGPAHIAAGGYHSLSISYSGGVVACGAGSPNSQPSDPNYGQAGVPYGLNGVTAVAAGGNHSLALKNDGSVAYWGTDDYPYYYGNGYTNLSLFSKAKAITASDTISMVLLTNGTVTGSGTFYYETYTNNSYTYYSASFSAPPGLTNVVAIAAGENHFLALKNNGTVVAWGDNYYNQTNVPAGLTNVMAIAAGWNHSLALLSNHTVVAWGNNSYGQSSMPNGLTNVVGVAAGGNRTQLILSGHSKSPGIIGFGYTYDYINDTASNVVVIVNRTVGIYGTATVDYTLIDNTAKSGFDFVGNNGTVQFTNGQSSASIMIPVIYNCAPTNTQSFYVRLSNPTGGAILSLFTNYAVYINYPKTYVQFDATNVVVNESGVSAVISATRTGNNSGTVTLDCVPSSGTALPNINYSPVTNNLSWTNGELGTKTAVFPIIYDNTVDSNLTFQINFANPSGCPVLGSQTNVSITILDANTPATVQWNTSDYALNGDGGGVTLNILRNGGPTNVSVSYTTIAGSALAGVDFVATNGIAVFAPNETVKSVLIPVIDHYPVQGDRNFTVQLTNPVAATLGAFTNVLATIHYSTNSPEILYGHRLYIATNSNFYFNQNNGFSNSITIYNPGSGTSRTGYVTVVETTNGIATGRSNTNPIPSIIGLNYYSMSLGGNNWSVQANDGKTYQIFATIYEASATNNLVSQPQDSEWIFTFDGTTSPPGAGAVDPNSGVVAPGFNPPPILTNVVVSGPALIQENSNAIYLATAFLNNGTTATNMSPTWTSTAFSISAAGLLTAGNVQADTPVTVAGTITYGNTITKSVAATIVNVQAAKLQGLGLTNKQFRLQLTGTTGRRYAIESTTNLASGNGWAAFTTNQIFSNSVFQLIDPGSTNSKTRFYRARQTP